MIRPLPAALLLAALAATAAAEGTALVAARLVDGLADAPRPGPLAVLVRAGRIQGVVPPGEIPAGYTRLDLGPRTLMPGLIDAHAHPLIRDDDYQVHHLKRSSAWKALRGLKVVQELMRCGWTTLRVAGDADVAYAHLDLRDVLEAGHFPGPRITGAGHYLSITGGGGDIHFASPEQALLADGLVVDGVDEVLKAVRTEVKYGSDWIKVLASGAFMSAKDSPRVRHFGPAEFEALFGEAARLGVPVMAHAHATEAIHAALRAGARSIEHGTFLDDEAIALFLETGAWLVPTLFIGDYFLEEHPESEAQKKMLELTRRYRARHREYVGKAIAAGVKIGVGTDFVGWPEPLGVRELELLGELGMSPMQVLRAATRGNAELLRWEDRIGAVAEGLEADLIAMPGDPSQDLQALRQVDFVMSRGEVFRAPAP